MIYITIEKMEVCFNVVDSGNILQCSISGDLLRTSEFYEICQKICAKRLTLSAKKNYTNLVINLTNLGRLDDGKLHKLLKMNMDQLGLEPLFFNLFILAENREKMFRKMVEYNIKYYLDKNPTLRDGQVMFFESSQELSEKIAFLKLKEFYLDIYTQGNESSIDTTQESTLDFQARISAMLEIVGPLYSPR